MFQLTNGTQASSTAQKSLSSPSKSTGTLIYRGLTYELPKCQTPEETQQLIGKELIYRGATYVIDRAQEAVSSPLQAGQRLIYRGATYTIADA